MNMFAKKFNSIVSNNHKAIQLGKNNTNFRIIVLLCLTVSVGRFSLDSCLPSLPGIAAHFKNTSEYTQLILTSYFFGYGISQVFYGPISERYGRRVVLLFGILIFLIGIFLCATSFTLNMIIFSRFISGVGAGSSGVLARAIITDVIPDDSIAHAWSQVTASIMLSLIAGPVIGAFIQEHYGFRINFVINFAYGVLVFIFLLIYLPETHFKKNKLIVKKIFLNYCHVIFDRKFISYVNFSVAAFSALVIYFQLSSFIFVNQFGLSPFFYGMNLCGIAISYVVGGKIINRIPKHVDAEKIIFFGGILILISGVFFTIFNNPTSFFEIITLLFFSFVFVVGVRIIIPTSISVAMRLHKNVIGYSAAVSGSFQMLGGAIVSYLVSKFSSKNELHTLSHIILYEGVIIFCFSYFLIRSKRHETSGL